MPALGPTKRRDLIHYLRQLGFTGPVSGARHQFMIRGGFRVAVPNPHAGEISVSLLTRILREAGIERADWERL